MRISELTKKKPTGTRTHAMYLKKKKNFIEMCMDDVTADMHMCK